MPVARSESPSSAPGQTSVNGVTGAPTILVGTVTERRVLMKTATVSSRYSSTNKITSSLFALIREEQEIVIIISRTC